MKYLSVTFVFMLLFAYFEWFGDAMFLEMKRLDIFMLGALLMAGITFPVIFWLITYKKQPETEVKKQ